MTELGGGVRSKLSEQRHSDTSNKDNVDTYSILEGIQGDGLGSEIVDEHRADTQTHHFTQQLIWTFTIAIPPNSKVAFLT